MRKNKNWTGRSNPWLHQKQEVISKEIISNQTIPLPLLAEQKRIVDRLEELLPLCDKLITNKEK